MKIVKESKVEIVTEEINIEQGTHYFSKDYDAEFYKIQFEEDEDGYITYSVTKLEDRGLSCRNINYYENGMWYKLPDNLSSLFLSDNVKKIKKEVFNKKKLELLTSI